MAQPPEAPKTKFRRPRALALLAPTVVFLLAANLWGTFEHGTINDSPFAEPWEMCDTVAYGWPLGAARWAAHRPLETVCDAPPGWSCLSDPCVDLPAFDLIAAGIDWIANCVVLLIVALMAGGVRAGLRALAYSPRELFRRDDPFASYALQAACSAAQQAVEADGPASLLQRSSSSRP